MEPQQKDLLEESPEETDHIRRRDLIPLWIKIFAWIFIVMGCFAPIGIIYGLMGNDFNLGLYGFATPSPLSIIGIGIITAFVLKGIVAFGLLKEKDWAVRLGMVDAIFGICACVFAMVYPLVESGSFTFRLELFVLIPYLVKLDKIRKPWEAFY